MSPRTDTNMRRLLRPCLLGAIVLALHPATGHAGTYDVPACDAAGGVNNSWAPLATDPSVAAYTECPSIGDPDRGMIARTVLANATAPAGTVGAMTFTAPPETAIVGLHASYEFARSDGRWEAALSTGSQVLRGCPAGGYECVTSSQDDWVDVPGSGSIYIDVFCASGPCPLSTDASTVSKARLYSATVRVEDDVPPVIGSVGGDLWSDRWLGGSQTVRFDASDNTGIRENTVLIDGRLAGQAPHTGCDYSYPTPCPNGGSSFDVNTRNFGDGAHQLVVQTTDSAGNASQLSRTIDVDNTPPGAPQGLAVDGGQDWRTTNAFAVTWTNPTGDGGAPVAGASWELCPSGKSTGCTTGSADKPSITGLPDIKTPGPGDWTLTVWLRDQAGNQDMRNAAPPVHLRFDNDAPSAAFALTDPSDPTKLVVAASDPTSGIGAGSIEIKGQTAEAWTPIATQVVPDGVVATLPDETLRDGAYDLRATVSDLAGNTQATAARQDGTPATVTLPVRAPTRLTGGRTRRHSKKLSTRIDLRYNARVALRGRLTDQAGRPMAHVALTVTQRTALSSAAWRPVKTIHTGKTGRFAFRAAAGPSRKIRIRYEGTPTVRPANADVTLRVAGSTTIHTGRHRLRNGQRARFSGRVKGTVRAGKLVQLQTRIGRRWQTFATAHTDDRGRWAHAYRFLDTHRRVTFKFRALVPRERGYPYRTGHSPSTRVTVTGT